jgi:GDP-L-fucose synthase
MEKNSKVLVLGGTGMVGSALLRKLKKEGYKNISSTYHSRYSKEENIEWIKIDLRQQKDVEELFSNYKPEYVFLAAARVGGIVANSTYKAEFIYDNLQIACNVVNSAHKFKVKKLLNLGSSCIYPKLAPQPLKEEYLLTSPLEETNEPYAIAKIAAIKLCRYYNEQYGTNFISLMPSNLYGIRDNFHLLNSHVLPALLRKVHLGKLLKEENLGLLKEDFKKNGDWEFISLGEIELEKANLVAIERFLKKFGIEKDKVTLWGSGNPYREFLYVDDLASACIYIMKNFNFSDLGEFVNVGSGKDLTIKELAQLIMEIVGFSGKLVFDKSKPDGTPRKVVDISKIKSLGWKPETKLAEGISQVYAWYLNRIKA